MVGNYYNNFGNLPAFKTLIEKSSISFYFEKMIYVSLNLFRWLMTQITRFMWLNMKLLLNLLHCSAVLLDLGCFRQSVWRGDYRNINFNETWSSIVDARSYLQQHKGRLQEKSNQESLARCFTGRMFFLKLIFCK